MVEGLLKECDDAMRRGDWKAAHEKCHAAVLQQPWNAQCLWRYAQVMGRDGQSEHCYEFALKAVQADGCEPRGWAILGGAMFARGDWHGARAASERALHLAPRFPMANWNLAHCLLGFGEYKRGFELYEWGVPTGLRRVRCAGRPWQGERIEGKTLFVWGEQGYGDVVMCSRFVKKAKELSGARVLFESPKELTDLLRGQIGEDWVFSQSEYSHVPEPFDFHVSSHSLPYVLGIEKPDDVRCEPYLRPVPGMDAGDVQEDSWGLVWAGTKSHQNDANRSMPAEHARQLEGAARFVSLQRGEELPFEMPNYGPALSSFAFTASLLTKLRGLVTVDTGVAHVAGALGVPTVLIAPLNGEWRWGLEGDKTPWYDSLTIVRPQGWEHAVSEVRRILAERGERQEEPRKALRSPAIPSYRFHTNGKAQEPAIA